MQRLTRPEVQRLTEAAPAILRVYESVLNSIFDEQGQRWTDFKLRVGGAMSGVELALNSRLQTRRALWHASMVLMSLKGAAPTGHDAEGTIETLASVAREACYDGALVELTGVEFGLLWALASRAGEVVSRDELYTDVLGARYDGLDRGVDIHLSRVRKKLADRGFDPGEIKSIRGAGYLLAKR